MLGGARPPAHPRRHPLTSPAGDASRAAYRPIGIPQTSIGAGLPFELLDVVGNDVSLAIQRELYLEFREPGFAPAPLLEHMVTAGYLGRKTGRGFRTYS